MGPFFLTYFFVMRSIICAAIVAASLAPTAVIAQQVDETPSNGPGSHPYAAALLFPIYLGARVQAALQPEKASCWNRGFRKVALCGVAWKYDRAVKERF